MKNALDSRKGLKLFGICTLCLTVLCVIFRIVALLFFFEPQIGYYVSGSPVAIIAEYLPALCALLGIVFCFIPKTRVSATTPQFSKITKLSAYVPAATFTLWTVLFAISLTTYSVLSLLFLISGALSAAFYFYFALRKKTDTSGVVILFGAFNIVWCVIALASSYFDVAVQMNAPHKIIFQFALLCAMILIVNEMRVGSDVVKSRFHLFSSCISTVLLATSALPSIIAFLLGKMPASYSVIVYEFILS